MDLSEKLPAVVGSTPSKRPYRTTSAALRQIVLLIVTFLIFYSVWKIPTLKKSMKSVPLEVHIVTKCSNARTALSELVLPAIERVHEKVDFRLSIVGKLPEDGSIECKHGPEECKGSIIELCAQDLYSDPRTSLGFVECLTSEYERIPDLALYEACASKHSVDFKEISHCATRNKGAYGRNLLRESIQHSIDVNASLNGTIRVISGTVRLNEEIYCIRDDDYWTNCPNGASVNNLVDAIESLHKAATEEL